MKVPASNINSSIVSLNSFDNIHGEFIGNPVKLTFEMIKKVGEEFILYEIRLVNIKKALGNKELVMKNGNIYL